MYVPLYRWELEGSLWPTKQLFEPQKWWGHIRDGAVGAVNPVQCWMCMEIMKGEWKAEWQKSEEKSFLTDPKQSFATSQAGQQVLHNSGSIKRWGRVWAAWGTLGQSLPQPEFWGSCLWGGTLVQHWVLVFEGQIRCIWNIMFVWDFNMKRENILEEVLICVKSLIW